MLYFATSCVFAAVAVQSSSDDVVSELPEQARPSETVVVDKPAEQTDREVEKRRSSKEVGLQPRMSKFAEAVIRALARSDDGNEDKTEQGVAIDSVCSEAFPSRKDEYGIPVAKRAGDSGGWVSKAN